MDERTQDTITRRNEVERLLGCGDAARLLQAARNALLALEFRTTDRMLGLPPVDRFLVEELQSLVVKVLEEASRLGSEDAAFMLSQVQLDRGDAEAALAAMIPLAEAGHPRATPAAAEIVWRAELGFALPGRHWAGSPMPHRRMRMGSSTTCRRCLPSTASAVPRTARKCSGCTRRLPAAATLTPCSSCTPCSGKDRAEPPTRRRRSSGASSRPRPATPGQWPTWAASTPRAAACQKSGPVDRVVRAGRSGRARQGGRDARLHVRRRPGGRARRGEGRGDFARADEWVSIGGGWPRRSGWTRRSGSRTMRLASSRRAVAAPGPRRPPR